jgi:hypothetical protein
MARSTADEFYLDYIDRVMRYTPGERNAAKA